jgi:hypothetical protein
MAKSSRKTKGFVNYVELALGANFFIICLRNCDEVKFLKQMHIPNKHIIFEQLYSGTVTYMSRFTRANR